MIRFINRPISELSSGGDAENITYNNTTSGLSADNVQDALDELKVAVDNKVGKLTNGFWVLTNRDNTTYAYGDVPFLQDNYTIINGELNASGMIEPENLVVGETYYQIMSSEMLNKFEIVSNDNVLEEFNTNREIWIKV